MRRLAILPLACLVAACGTGRAGASHDAGTPADAGTTSDAGATTDAGSPTDAGTPDGGAAPWVHFVTPAPGATVANPVTFTIAASGVDSVQIFADQTWPLAPASDPTNHTTLTYRFVNTGVRSLDVVGFLAGARVAREDLSITVSPDSCEDRYFLARFDAANTDPTGTIDLAALREQALAAVHSAVAELGACGATVTLGGMMSLLHWEGALRLGAYNTICSQNSYDPMPSGCDAYPEALYSYQYGLGAIHTSNFHPCKGGAWTQGMRALFTSLATAAGYDTDPSLVTQAVADRFHQICPSAMPEAIDYYLLAAHDAFGVPKNAAGNDLAAVGSFPFFDPSISVRLTFHAIEASCASIASDRDAITAFGGGDASYADPAVQDRILADYQSFAAASCP